MNRRITEKLKFPESIRIPVLGGVSYRLLSKTENKLLDKEVLPDCALNTDKRDITVTASLTSFPGRIDCVHKSIKSIMLQSYRPDRIILWLAQTQFPDKKLPESIENLKKHGLTVNWCDDLCSHKKYYYAVKEQKENEVIITFDDDIIYPIDAIKRLMKLHEKFPDCIVCERAQAVDYDENGKLKNPGRWKTISSVGVKQPSFGLSTSAGSGCLIPYGAFYKDLLDKEKIKKYVLKGDDLWFMFMAAENGTRIVKTRKYHKTFTLISNSQEFQLATENIVDNKYKKVMEDLAKEYPTAYRRILTDKF